MKKKFGMATGLLMIAVLLVSMAIGAAYAKYVTQKTLEDTLTITADIGTIKLLEHKAVRNADGSYYLTSETVAANSYVLIPGLDIPKDPYVVITKPDTLPVYVYVEVVDGLGTGSGITYALTGDWTDLGITGPNGGRVYAYKSSFTQSGTIYILNNDTVYVGQKLNMTGDPDLKFYAYMYQAIEGKTAEEVYTAFRSAV